MGKGLIVAEKGSRIENRTPPGSQHSTHSEGSKGQLLMLEKELLTSHKASPGVPWSPDSPAGRHGGWHELPGSRAVPGSGLGLSLHSHLSLKPGRLPHQWQQASPLLRRSFNALLRALPSSSPRRAAGLGSV